MIFAASSLEKLCSRMRLDRHWSPSWCTIRPWNSAVDRGDGSSICARAGSRIPAKSASVVQKYERDLVQGPCPPPGGADKSGAEEDVISPGMRKLVDVIVESTSAMP